MRSTEANIVAVPIPLSPDEQQAIVSFGERAPTLSRDRAEELAELMDPVLPEIDALKLQGHANGLAGGAGGEDFAQAAE